MRITLASASPRRRELIQKIKWVECAIVPSDADESVMKSEDPITLTKSLALFKAEQVYKKVGGIVLGSDTVVCVDGKILGKPKTKTQAREFLKMLCGRDHKVITAVAVVSDNKTVVDAEISLVFMLEYDEEWATEYIATGSPFDKAGGYGIQDAHFQKRLAKIEGDLDNIIGLPVKLTEKLLQEIKKANGNA